MNDGRGMWARLRIAVQRARHSVRQGLRDRRWPDGGPRWATFRARLPLKRRELTILGLILGVLVFTLWERCGVRGCPNVERLNAYQPGGASVLLDRSGEPFADLSPVRRQVVELDDLPQHVSDAFVAVEDKRFYEHSGVDWRRVGGAMAANIRAGGVSEGFSTITMQLARNVFPDRLPGQKRTLKRKLLEVRVAREIEEKFDKDEILELYLNHIYFGGGAYGIEAAAHHYFGKDAEDLKLSESALLVAMVKGPSYYDPRRHAERAKNRRNLSLTLMEQQGLISPKGAEEARDTRLGVRREPPAQRDEQRLVAPYFAESVRRVLEDRFGEDIYTSTLKVYTTLDRRMQRIAEEELRQQLAAIERGRYGRYRGDRYDPSDPPGAATDYLQGAVVVMNADSGDVRAMVGGRDFRQSRFDRATRARRQPGSAFKPFVYAVALAEGYAPTQRLRDDTLRLQLAGGEVWEPRNFTGEFEGPITLRESLVRSKNVPTVRLSEAVGRGSVMRLARSAGIRGQMDDTPALALGTAGVSPLEMASAYTAFANGGMTVEPRLITRVEDGDGKVVWKDDVDSHRLLGAGVAYLLTHMLQEALSRGTGTNVRSVGLRGPAAGKTGTTNDGADVWFVGYTPEVVASVWIGFDSPRQILPRASGGRLAAPVWGRMMHRIHRGRAVPGKWDAPEEIVERPVDPATGLVLSEGCRPESGKAETELFVEGQEPASTCPRGDARDGGPGLFDKLFARTREAWNRLTDWVSGHFGREEQVPPPSTRDRYLGAPRLPRVNEIPVPEVEPELYESVAPDSILVPEVPPLDVETLTVPEEALDTALLGNPVLRDTMRRPTPRPDTVRRDTVRRDTVPRPALPVDTTGAGGSPIRN